VKIKRISVIDKYIYILIFCSFFLWKVLIARAQCLLFDAELGDGSLVEINLDLIGKEFITKYSLTYIDDPM
jgi:hypothetical protein